MHMAYVSCTVAWEWDTCGNFRWGNGPCLVLGGQVGFQNWISGVPKFMLGGSKLRLACRRLSKGTCRRLRAALGLGL